MSLARILRLARALHPFPARPCDPDERPAITPDERSGLDPISFEVIRNALVAATDEMVLTLRRSAYSTNIKTRSDFSCAFFDAELRSVASAAVDTASNPT